LSLPFRRESSDVKRFWIPAFAGMTFLEAALIFKSPIEGRIKWGYVKVRIEI